MFGFLVTGKAITFLQGQSGLRELKDDSNGKKHCVRSKRRFDGKDGRE